MGDAVLRVLMVEDELHHAELQQRLLVRGGLSVRVQRVDTEEAFRRALGEPGACGADIILSDFSMPLFDGLSALVIAKQLQPDTPFIFVSGTIGEAHAVNALKSGATDYVLKSDLARLVPAVERAMQDVRTLAERRRVQAALQHSELRFRLAASTGDVWDWTMASGEFYVSRQWKERLGYQEHEIANTVEAWLELMHPEDRDAVRAALRAHLDERRPYDIEFRARCLNGEHRWSHAKGQAVWNEAGRATYMAGSVVDVTERKLAEIRVGRLNRLYAVLSGINSVVVRVDQREDLFRESCRIAVDVGQFRLAWIARPVPAQGPAEPAGRLSVAAWHGVGENYLRTMPMALDESRPGALAAVAWRGRAPVVVQDASLDPRVFDHEAAAADGLRSFAILPLTVDAQVVGVIGLYASEPGFFDATEMKLLADLASDIAFAMDHIEKAERLNYLAYYDALTGLANRSLFHERLAQYVETARRDGSKLALLALNVDRFRQVNDSLGRCGGDELLKQIAQRLQASAVDSAWCARTDADRFAIIVPELKSEALLARRIEQTQADCFGLPFLVAGTELRISVRTGIATFPVDGADVETLIRHAEDAGQKARSHGETYLFYTQEMSDRIAGALALENRLRRALEEETFVLHYQSKVDAVTGRILGVEALIRWQDEEMGLVPPGRFIPLMEQTGMIVEVGAWALRRAVADHLHWCRQGLAAVPRIAVNVSPIQLRRADFVPSVRAIVAAGAPVPGIDLEITESLVMEDIQGNIEKLRKVRELGLNIAVDDFGTGYSSLRYLALLPVQTLKIDQTFISTMLDDAATMTLVSTIVSLAHTLHLKVVAEGVETRAQAACLRRLGCDELQGYLFSRPMPLARMTETAARPGPGVRMRRIEVLTGPGDTPWGANAVNGVIKVITRETVQTQGALAEWDAALGRSEFRRAAFLQLRGSS